MMWSWAATSNDSSCRGTPRAWRPLAFGSGPLAIALLLALASAAAPRPTAAQGVHVALMPAALQVAPGSTFDLEIDVTQAGSNFNGFDIYIGYDPSAVSLVPLSPISLQEGSYFTSACGNRFHRFR